MNKKLMIANEIVVLQVADVVEVVDVIHLDFQLKTLLSLPWQTFVFCSKWYMTLKLVTQFGFRLSLMISVCPIFIH